MSDTLFDLAPEPLPERTHACTGITCQVCHDTAATAATAAMKRGSKAADPAWIDAAGEIMWERYRSGREFTTDEVMEALEELGVETHDSRALGGVVLRFLNKGLIHEVGTAKSRRRHGARIPVYVGTSSPQKAGTPMKEHDAFPSSSPVPVPPNPPRSPSAHIHAWVYNSIVDGSPEWCRSCGATR